MTAWALSALLVIVPLAGVQLAEQVRADEPEKDAGMLLAQHERHEMHGDHDSESSAGQRAYEKGYELHSKGLYEEAAASFERALDEGFRAGASMYNIACCHALMGDADGAMQWLERAIGAGFDDPENLVDDSDFDRIRTDAAFQRFIDDAFANAGREREFPEHYPYRATMERFQELKDSGSTDGKEWHDVGFRLLSLGEHRMAIDAFTAAVDHMGEKKSTAMYNLACSHSLAGNERQALDWLERAVDAGMDQHERFLNDADLNDIRNTAGFERIQAKSEFLSLGRFPQRDWEKSPYSVERWAPAIEEYRAYVTDNPSSGRGWFNLGWALHHSERFDEALGAFEKAASRGFRPGTSTYNVACGNAKLGRTAAAIEALEAAVAVSGPSLYGQIEHDDDLDSLRDDPRFIALAGRLEAEMEARIEAKVAEKMARKHAEKLKHKDKHEPHDD